MVIYDIEEEEEEEDTLSVVSLWNWKKNMVSFYAAWEWLFLHTKQIKD